ncbi:hypothetical protein CSQ89_19895 [Chitinimonas sp. BJB300]|nr:hypothetical protein CSQ89_19895 [Chitinimonas sp. BJB300]
MVSILLLNRNGEIKWIVSKKHKLYIVVDIEESWIVGFDILSISMPNGLASLNDKPLSGTEEYYGKTSIKMGYSRWCYCCWW